MQAKGLSIEEREFLMECLANGKTIPDDFREKLFPTTQKEYELRYAGKMRKEDLLADQDGTFAVPLQIEKIYNGTRKKFKDDWRNMIVFGDNLQFLKTISKNEDTLIRGKVKGKVKLIYIDPPFGTDSDFEGDNGQKAYTDKAKDADFIEFIRRRLIVARELLADDGSIFVHLDWKKCHYIKLIMDEIFGENHFVNEMIWYYEDKFATGGKALDKNHDVIYRYSKGRDFIGNSIRIPKDKITKRALRQKINGKTVDVIDESGNKTYIEYSDKVIDDVWQIGRTISKEENFGYPTQKKEELIKRILLYGSNEGDIVLDFFAGSGTTAAVSEKLNRRWITCDIGKYSFYTIQKRLLTIEHSKSLENPKKKYGKHAKTFVTVNTGVYDLKKMQELNREKYVEFALGLFEVAPKKSTRKGFAFHGERKDGYPVIVWEWKDSHHVDTAFLQSLHDTLGKSAGRRIYIIAPINAVDFVGDYEEIGDTRYYFLKIPYQIIRELHPADFEKIRQPRSKSNVNELDNAVGFHFGLDPEVKSCFKKGKLVIKEFYSNFKNEEKKRDFDNFESLSMVIIDDNYNGKDFIMSQCVFSDEMEEIDDSRQIAIENPGNMIRVIYIDIFGNEAKEVIKIK
jgi:site-specific DNA-methyltransferase (adenine-specific)/adenine-specific DNA-methyltransferase